jgi:hypothetical protein
MATVPVAQREGNDVGLDIVRPDLMQQRKQRDWMASRPDEKTREWRM